MGERRRFLVALILEGDVAREIDGLRRALGSKDVGRIAPHLTLVPPVNVPDDDEPAILEGLRGAAASVRPLEVVLGPPCRFPPPSSVLFLALGGDLTDLHALHARLGSLPLSPRVASRERPFVPHVTLARLEPATVAAAERLLAGYARSAAFDRLSLLEQCQQAPGNPWDVIADWTLGPATVVGRGGRELSFTVGTQLDPDLAPVFDDEWARYSIENYGAGSRPDAPIAVVTRAGDAPVGFALGKIVDETLRVDLLIVRAGERGTGIGGQLLGFLEGLARDRGCRRLRVLTIAGGPAAAFYERHGYRATALLPAWRQGRDFSVMERPLSG